MTKQKSVHCSPDVVTDLDEKSAEEREAEANGAKPQDDPSVFLKRPDETPREYAIRIWQRVYCRDIENVLSMEVRHDIGDALPILLPQITRIQLFSFARSNSSTVSSK